MGFEEGAVINDRYRLDRVIGRGGMADVYAGYDGLLDRPVAVKVPLPGFHDDDRFQRRFAKEARAAAALNHPNVVSIFDRGTDGEVTYLVMELVTGSTLRQIIDARGFTEEEALAIARDVCAGLEYAHAQGFVHRDLKPDNVLITEDGTVKVTDFGIVRAIGDRSITSTRPLGSVAYVSPEQATGGDVDHRSDLYSLGVVLFEMLTGTRPFDADSPVSIALAHIEKPPPDVRDVVRSVSAEAAEVVRRALAKAPADRFASAGEMREAIEVVLGPAAAPGTADVPAVPDTDPDTASADLPTVAFDPASALPTGEPPVPSATTRALHASVDDEDRRGGGGRGGGDRRGVGGDVRQRVTVGAIALLAVLVLVSLFPSSGVVRTPELVGLDGEAARAVLADRDLGIAVVGFDEDAEAPDGTVLTAEPPAGTPLGRGGVVRVTLAGAPGG